MRPAMKNPDQIPEQQLIAQIQAGNEAAFERLVRRFYEELCAFMEAQIGHATAAEDLVQDIFLNLWRRRGEWEPRSTLRAYLFGAARNASIKYRKRRQVRRRWKREEREKDPPREPGPDDAFRHRELEYAFQEGVSELPERRRQVFVLSRHHGLTYKEIAVVMDITPSTVDNQMVEALRFLRGRLHAFLSTTA
jgi:RNA polymerase sigma-70 factor (ECF subfamily)